MLVVVNIANAS